MKKWTRDVCDCQMPLLSCLSASCCLPHEIQLNSSHFSIKGKKFRTYKNRLAEGKIDYIMLLNANEWMNEDMNRFTRMVQRHPKINEQIMLNQIKQQGFTLHFSICTICLYIIVWDVFKCGREFSFPVLKMHFLGVSEGKLVWSLSGNLLPPSTKDPFFGRFAFFLIIFARRMCTCIYT